MYESACVYVSTFMGFILLDVGGRLGRVRSVAAGFGLHDIVAVDALHRALVGLLEI